MASEFSTKIDVLRERRGEWAGGNLPITLPSYEFMKTHDSSYGGRDERVSISWDGQRLKLEGPGAHSTVLYDSRPPPLPPVVVVDWRANEKAYSLEAKVRGFTGVYSVKVDHQSLNVDVIGDEGPLSMDYLLPADVVSEGVE